MFQQILAKLPPKLILDHYWEVLNVIDWKILPITKSREFTIQDILAYFSKEIERKIDHEEDYYCKLLKEAKDVTEETIAYLTNVGLIKIDGDKLVKTREYSGFVKFLKECLRKSIIRKVSWAIWYLYNQKNLDCFKVSQILDVLLDKNIDEKTVERALKRLKLQFRNGSWCLTDEALSKIRDNLKGKPSIYWPFFGIFYVRNTRYFKILRGQSCTAYVDVPNEILLGNDTGEGLIGNLTVIDEECKDKEEFLNKASKIVEYYNKILRSKFKDFIGTNIDWLSYRIVNIPFTDKSKFGIRVTIEWSKFLKFIEDYPKLNIELWKKYRYISACRRPALYIILRGHELERTQEMVREQSSKDIEEILKTFNELINFLAVVKDSLVKIQARIQRKTQINYIILTLQYLAEMSSVAKALKHFIENGVIPACYIEMRKLIENLAWVLFDDILSL